MNKIWFYNTISIGFALMFLLIPGIFGTKEGIGVIAAAILWQSIVL